MWKLTIFNLLIVPRPVCTCVASRGVNRGEEEGQTGEGKEVYSDSSWHLLGGPEPVGVGLRYFGFQITQWSRDQSIGVGLSRG